MRKRVLSLVLALIMVIGVLPMGAMAAEVPESSSYGTVQVIVENNTTTGAFGDFWMEGATQWTGKRVDTTVELKANSNGISVVVDAIKSLGTGHTIYGDVEKKTEPANYIAAIDGLKETGSGGWLSTLNDWFVADSLDGFTVANGMLKDGDVVRMVYSVTGGSDVGSRYNDATKTLSALTITGASLTPTFSSSTYNYELALGEATSLDIVLTPTATNKNFLAGIFKGELTQANAKSLDTNTWYNDSRLLHRGETVNVKEGDVLTVVVGAPKWPSLSNGQFGCCAENTDPCVYTIRVVKTAADPNEAFNGFFTGLSGVATVENDATYPMTVDETESALVSSNAGKGSSFSGITLTFQQAAKLSFSYKASSEEKWDYLKLTKTANSVDTELNSDYSVKPDFSGSMTAYKTYSLEMNAGEKLRLGYYKDSSGDSNSDCVWVKDFTVTLPNQVVFHANDGTETTAQQGIFGTADLNANTFTREGYRFDGWATTANGEVAYADGAKITLSGADVDLYAVWTKVWNVTFPNMPQGASITVKQGDTVIEPQTDGNWLLPDGSYTYSASLFGYESATDVTFTVDGADNAITSGLTASAKTKVNFNVTGVAEGTAVTITVYNSENTLMAANEDGTYSLPAGTYTYSVTAKGYQKVKNQTLTLTTGETTKPVDIALAASNAWDGETVTTPTKSGDVYQISSGEELAGFAKLVNDGEMNAKGILTADIALNEDGEWTHQWTPIGSTSTNAFIGSFDGAGHTITGLYIDGTDTAVGLFGYIGAAGTVSDLRMESASVKSTASSSVPLTAIIAAENQGEISGVTLVSGTVSGSSIVGGIAGQNTGTITGCANEGVAVEQNTAKDQGVGGIVGKNKGVVSYCYNKAHIVRRHSSTDYTYLGGLVGQNDSGTIESCYNTGEVDTAYYSGGIAGKATGTVKYCYNVGTVPAAKKALIGNGTPTVTGCFYLNTCGATDTKGTSKTADEFKTLSASLGGAFENTDTYPILKWQNPNATYSITLTVMPADAVVTVTGTAALTGTKTEDTDAGTATYSYTGLSKGSYAWSVACDTAETDDFVPQNGTFVIATADVTKAITLEKKTYDVTFQLTPASAELTLTQGEGEDAVTLTPKTAKDADGKVVYALPMGSYNYQVTAFGYETASGTVTVVKTNGLAQQNISLTRSSTHTLTFTGVPEGATVTVEHATGGVQTQQSNGNGAVTYSLVPETYSYKIKLAGYKTVKDTVTVGDGDQSIAVTMTALGAWDGTVADGFADGSGTAASPYEIESGAELAYLSSLIAGSSNSTYKSCCYVLTNDIDMGGKLGTPSSFTPIGISSSKGFAGYFDGQNHTISNLYVSSSDAYAGLFGYVGGGKIENVILDGAVINCTNTSHSYAGALAGRANVVTNCVVKNSSVTGVSDYVGGLTGYAYSKVTKCAVLDTTVSGSTLVGGLIGQTTSSVNVTLSYGLRNTVSASGQYAGGLVGGKTKTVIKNCFVRGGLVTAEKGCAGGLIGAGGTSSYSAATIANSYASVNVNGGSGCYGALTGDNDSTYGGTYTTVTDSSTFYCSENTLTGKTLVTKGTAKTPMELKNAGILTSLGSEFAIYVQDDGVINAGLPYLTNAPGNVKINPTALTAPTVTWTGKTASWTAVENATGYAVTLTKGDETLFNETMTALEQNFTGVIDLGGSGAYTLSVTALGDGENTGNSTAATAEATFTVNSANVTFQVTAADGKTFADNEPVITLTLADGVTTVTLTNNEARSLPQGSYTYTVKAKTFGTKTGNFSLTKDETISLTMDFSAVWDGETTMEPTLTDGVYQISNGYELAWFRDEVNEKSANYGLSAKLVGNIDLGNYAWTPIATFVSYTNANGYTGTFDGSSFKISGLNPSANASGKGAGLFGSVSGSGKIKDLTVEGALTAVQYSGGVAASMNGGTIQNCVSKINITTTTTGSLNVGGIAGYLYGTATVIGCWNEGTVNGGSGNYVGGIAGYAYNTAAITNCANSGSVFGGERVGGIVGQNSATLAACYNSGAVSGSNNIVGGIAGYANYKEIKNCFNAGTVTGAKSNVGGIVGSLYNTGTYAGWMTDCLNSGTVSSMAETANVGALVGTEAANASKPITGSYYLTGTATKAIGANAVDADETTGVDSATLNSKRLIGLLGGAFASVDSVSGPVLKWQYTNAKCVVTFVTTPADATVTVTDKTAVSGEAGVYVLADGDYDYTVSKTGYNNASGTVTVSGASQSVPVELSIVTYDVTFNVTTEGAKITVTNAEGEPVAPKESGGSVYSLPNGTYSYVVSKFGCTSVTGTFTVSSAEQTLEEITLSGATMYTVTLTFADENEEAVTPTSVTVSSGTNTIEPNAGGAFTYSLPNGTYTCTVDDTRYYKVEETFTVSDAAKTVSIALETNKTWDGTQTAVTPNDDGVYEISTAAELAWFAAQVNTGNTGYNAKLTANIYVNYGTSSNTWTSIGSYNKQYTGTFDGNGKKINGLNAALFGYIGTGGLVKDVTVYGNVSGESNVGGICNASYGSFEGCVSHMTVTATGQRVGGIVGLLYADGHITNCANYGAVSTSYSALSDTGSYADVGGVVGKSLGAVQGCFNAGEVKETSDSYGSAAAGGVVGELDGAAMTNCYNTGAVSAAHRGGVVGVTTGNGAAVTNCYNVGTVSVVGTAQNPYCGAVAGELKNSSSVDNCYYLEGCYTYNKGSTTHAEGVGNNAGGGTAQTVSKTASEMKLDAFATALSPTDKAFHVDSENINKGYPVLAWQGGREPSVSQDEQDVAADKAALTLGTTTVTTTDALTLPTTGENGSVITWASSHPGIVAIDGTVTLPTDNDVTVTLTATLTKGGVSDTKEFTLLVKTRATADQAALEKILAKLGTKFRVSYSATGANAADAVKAKLAAAITSAGVTGLTADQITVSVVGAGSTTYGFGSGTLIANDGAVTYYYVDPTATNTINGDATVGSVQFKLTTSSGASVTTENCTVQIPWDQAKIKAAMQAGADALTFDTIKGANTSADAVTSDLTLPQQLDGYGWALISWESSNESVISVEENGALEAFTGDVLPDEDDQTITLTATFTFNKNNTEEDGTITVTKDITVTVTGASSGYQAAIDAALEKFALGNLKYSAGENKGSVIDPNAVTDNIQLPTPSNLGIDGGRNGFKVVYSASVAEGGCPVTVNGYSAKVVRPIGTAPVTVTLTLTLTKQTNGVLNTSYTGTKSLTIKVSPLDMDVIDAELALLDAAKAAYFDGINDGKNVSKDAVTGNLHAFQEVYQDATGKLVWVYNINDVTDTGIVPTELEGYDSMGSYGASWRLFKSSDTDVITHENLLVTQPTTVDVKVTITSRLKSYRFGGYYEVYKDEGYSEDILNKFKRLAGEDVSVELTVISTEGQSSVNAVKSLIDAIGNPVTLDSKSAIEAAETAYAALTDGRKALVSNYETLTAARAAYDQLANETGKPTKPSTPSVPNKPDPELPSVKFDDVTSEDWFYDDVEFVVRKGLFEGTSTTTFSPEDSMTRAMLVTVLYRMEGEPTVHGDSSFDDVAADQWYTKAVIWAEQNHIINGTGDGLFGINNSVTREQIATILYRYAAYKGYRTTSTTSLSDYSDWEQISAYAVTAMKWANMEGLITGRTDATLDPQGDATRAEVAAIFHRFMENLVD